MNGTPFGPEELSRSELVEWGMAAALVVVGCSLLLRPRSWVSAFMGALSHPATPFIGGLYAFLVGLVVVLAHNIWVADARVLVTIVGWVSLLFGTAFLLMPELLRWTIRQMPLTPRLVAVRGFVRLAVGATVVGYLISSGSRPAPPDGTVDGVEARASAGEAVAVEVSELEASEFGEAP